MNGFSLRKQLDTSFDDAVARLPEVLKSEGFGVLTEIDMQATLKAKLGVDIRRYKIFGACNPPFANQALEIDLAAGLMMPCNMVVYEDDHQNAVVLAIDPTTITANAGSLVLQELAAGIKAKLARVLEKI
ncbi:MAG: DUF302 domain-containing protein [Kofleriaceae bacterium]|nr:DUF302 domain-containing protein [Kofleriaceae bacterium]